MRRKTATTATQTGARQATPARQATASGAGKRVSKGRGKASAGKKKATRAKSVVVVVNMIPNSLSGETNQDSEPTITVSQANPLHMAASAFTPDPAGGSVAPIYISTDGGMSWSLNSIVPSSAAQGSMTADITVSFGAGNRLYAGIIRLPFSGSLTRLNILRTDDFQSATPMKVLIDKGADTTLANKSGDANARFGKGEGLFMFNGDWQNATYDKDQPQGVGFFVFPSGDTGGKVAASRVPMGATAWSR